MKLLELAWPEFAKGPEGIIALRSEFPEIDTIQTIDLEWCLDKTGFEASVNHVHLADKLTGLNHQQYQELGRKIGAMWAAKLRTEFPDLHFRVYFHAGTTESEVVLRFHQVWPNEPPWLLESDFLDDLKKEQLVVWNT